MRQRYASGVNTNERGYVEVDPYQESSAKGVYAVGDVIDRVALTPVAIQEGMALGCIIRRSSRPRGIPYIQSQYPAGRQCVT